MHEHSTFQSKPEPASLPTQAKNDLVGEAEIDQPRLSIQYKLSIGAVDDPLEKEADAMAEQVMRMPEKAFIQRKCSQCEEEEKVQRKPLIPFIQKKTVQEGSSVSENITGKIKSTRGSGSTMVPPVKSFMESRFGSDFSGVRIHTDTDAVQLSTQLNAQAFTVGNDIYFNEGKFNTNSRDGKRLLAHELTHTIQQGGSHIIRREPIFNDTTCNEQLQDNIRNAWNVAVQWIRRARVSLSETASVGSLLQNHFKIDPENTEHMAALDLVRDNFTQMAELIQTNINNRCTSPNRDSRCQLPDGRFYDAYVHGGRPGDGIWHCVNSADAGFLGRANLIQAVVHEIAHLTTNSVTDHAYRHQGSAYRQLTQEQAIHNADSYSEFAQDVFMNRVRLGMLRVPVSIGTLLSSGSPQWIISASTDFRSFSGLEVFDLIGGMHYFMGVDGEFRSVRTLGAAIDFGILSRSPDTHFFADTRVGVFGTMDPTRELDPTLGITLSTTIGWANDGFRAGVNVRPMFDLLQGNHSVIIGGEFGVEF